MEFVKMTRSDIPKVKKMLIAQQKGICPVCGKDLTRTKPVNVVIDHDHTTGVVRAALHRGCNGLDGKVLRLVTTWGKAKGVHEAMDTLQRIVDFWDLHLQPQTKYIYYNHKTAAEKRAAYNAKQRRNYAKRKNSKMESG